MAKKDNRTTFRHIRAEQGRGACLVCASPLDSSTECSGRYRSPEPGGPRDKSDGIALDSNPWTGGRPDGWG
jgi:hypothetical protein